MRRIPVLRVHRISGQVIVYRVLVTLITVGLLVWGFWPVIAAPPSRIAGPLCGSAQLRYEATGSRADLDDILLYCAQPR